MCDAMSAPEGLPAPQRKFRLGNLILRWLAGTSIIALSKLVGYLPFSVLAILSRVFALVAWPFARRMRRKIWENLRDCMGEELTEAERKRLMWKLLCNYMMAGLLTLRMARLSHDQLREMVRIEGKEHLDRALSKGLGVIGLGAHLGPFTYMGARLAIEGYPYAVVVRMASDIRLEQTAVAIRQKFNVHTYYRGPQNRSILRALKNGEIVHLFLDQHVSRGGAVVRFFGHPAPTFTGPAVLSRRLGSPVVPIFIFPEGPFRWVVEISPELEFEWTEDEEADIVAAVQRMTDIIEAAVRRCPEQWAWMHRRWIRRTDRPKYVRDDVIDELPAEVREYVLQRRAEQVEQPTREPSDV